MIIEWDYEYIPITEQEYKDLENNLNLKNDGSLLDIITKVDFETKYPKQPIYKGGLDNTIIGYKYYKRGNAKHLLICSDECYKRLINLILDDLKSL